MKTKNRKLKAMIITLLTSFVFVCLTGLLLAYIPAQMTEKHTIDIVELYF